MRIIPSGKTTSDVTGNKNGNEVTYIGTNGITTSDYGYNNGIFLTYDVVDENGKVTTYTATKLEESQIAGDGGYKVIKEEEPVLVSSDQYYYNIPSEVKEIIGVHDSWLASACVGTSSYSANFDVCFVYGGCVDAGALCGSHGLEGVGDLAVRPVVSLSSKLIEQGSEGGEGTEGYNVWKLK